MSESGQAGRDTALVAFAQSVLHTLEIEEEWNAETLDTIQAEADRLGLCTTDEEGMFRRTDAAQRVAGLAERNRWCCPCCDSRHVQVSRPAWSYETNDYSLHFVETDGEASVMSWYCEDCGESGGAPKAADETQALVRD